MIIGWRRLGVISAAVIGAAAVACDTGAPSKTRDDIAADSALASDLALANRDTLLVDSIGEYRPPDAAERDTAETVTTGSVAPVKSEPSKPVATAPAPPAPGPIRTPAATVASGPTRRGTAACTSPIKADQEKCVKAILPGADMRLNRIYRALVTEMRRKEGVPNGGRDPASVERLRVSQRSWLVYRDNQCRRRGRGKEGALWARPRVKCLSEFSARRANELADQFSRLTAH